MAGYIDEMFSHWNETMIRSCLQGIMGELHTNASGNAAMAMLGDFVFYAGQPSKELLLLTPQRDFLIMVPQTPQWAELIEQCYLDKARKVIRYAMKKEPDIFDIKKLNRAASTVPQGYELKIIGEAEYDLCRSNPWANDLVSQYKSYEMYKKLGVGVVAVKNGELTAGASSYSTYAGGIEIQIDTREDQRTIYNKMIRGRRSYERWSIHGSVAGSL